MKKKGIWITLLVVVVAAIGGIFGYRYYTSKTAVPKTFAGRVLETYVPNYLFVDMTISFANGHAYLLPTQASTAVFLGNSPTSGKKTELKPMTKTVFKMLVGSTDINDIAKVKVGQKVDLGRAEFTRSGKQWTVTTPKLTLKLRDRGDTSFKSQDGTFWLLRKDDSK